MVQTMIDIEITHDLYSNCAQDVFLNLLRYMNLDPIYLLSSAWSSTTPPLPNEMFGDVVNIYEKNFVELEKVLSGIYNIKLIWHTTTETSTTILL